MHPTFVEGGDGLAIATWELGGPDEPAPVVLVAHATGFHTRCYRALAAGLASRFRVVGFDLRAHGHSRTPPLDRGDDGVVPTMDWRRFAEDALAVVDALALERPVAFGHSCGGATLLLAEQRRPGTFAAIYAYEPVVGPPQVWARMDARGGSPAEGARHRRPVFASRAAALEHFSSKAPLSSLRGDVLVDYVEGGFADLPDGTIGLRCQPDAEAATYAMAVHAGTWEVLAQVGCPTTVACGGHDGEFGLATATAVAARLRDGRVDEHPHLGHLGPLERPDEVAEAAGGALG